MLKLEPLAIGKSTESKTAVGTSRLVQKYATPGYEGRLFENTERSRVVQRGESSSYAKTRNDLDAMKVDMRKQQKRYSSVLKKEVPVIPNRLNGHANSMRNITKVENNLSGYFGYGIKDANMIYKPTSNFEVATKGKLKTNKQNRIIINDNVKYLKSQLLK